ncbi:MAG: TPR end-of-group domain-containing protein, partial [Pyrinomonadaceae bacterium]
LDQQRPGSIDKAREYLERAVELDPNYAKAWAGKAYAYSIMWGAGRPSDPENPFDKYARSMEAANRALAIDPDLSEAYTSICENKFAYEFNFDEAEKNCKRAIDLDPNSAPAHRLYSMLLTSRGRSEEAFAEIKTAMQLEPASLRNQRIFANALYYARRYEEAIEAYKRLFDLNPEATMTHLYLIRSLERSGRESEAFDFLIKLLILEKKDDATIERFRAAYALSGWRGVLNERIKTELQEKSPQYSVVAEYYGLLGDKAKAFEYLEKVSQKRGWMKMFFGVDPRFDTLRNDPRFNELVRRIETN